ncbi:MAG: hypothetical protein E7391_00230 [Ruminococcaceae bacterium]|nr:hypothetical protein [Oscillospiraceae bacterium]
MGILSTFYIIVITLGLATQNIVKKRYNNKVGKKGTYSFSAFSVLVSLLIFILRCRFKFEYDIAVTPYVIVFTVSYCLALLFNYFALQCGSLSLTSLFLSYSLLIPTFYGVIFDGDDIKMSFYIGLCFLVVSLFFLNTHTDNEKITLKWVIFTLLSLVGNGLCSTIQTIQQQVFEQKYQNEFMITSLVFVTIFLFVFVFVREKDEFKFSVKIGAVDMMLCGIANATVNIFVMIVSGIVAKSLMFPLISAGCIVVTWLVSATIYKEKMTKSQNIAIILGIISIIFLNI